MPSLTCTRVCTASLVHDEQTVRLRLQRGRRVRPHFQDDLEGSIPLAVFAMQIITMLILLLWEANFHKQQLVTAQQVNARSVTAGDYAAIISGLGTNGFTREDLAAFMSHYGEVASVVYTRNIGTLLKAEHELCSARVRLR